MTQKRGRVQEQSSRNVLCQKKSIASSQTAILGKLDELAIETYVRYKLNIKLEKMSDFLSEVESLHKTYVRLLSTQQKFENDTMIQFADTLESS